MTSNYYDVKMNPGRSFLLYFASNQNFKKLSEKFADKRNITLSETTCYIRTKLSFALIKGVVLCIRGSRGPREKYCPVAETDISLANYVSGAIELVRVLMHVYLHSWVELFHC